MQHLEKEAVLLSVSGQETEILPNFFPATFLDGKKFVESLWKTAVNVTLFVFISVCYRNFCCRVRQGDLRLGLPHQDL